MDIDKVSYEDALHKTLPVFGVMLAVLIYLEHPSRGFANFTQMTWTGFFKAIPRHLLSSLSYTGKITARSLSLLALELFGEALYANLTLLRECHGQQDARRQWKKTLHTVC
jgi:hypothetical protein